MLHNTTHTRNYSLDALKIASAIGIYCFHYSEKFTMNNAFLGETVLSRGYYLVELFFIISGYLMATKEEEIAKKSFSVFFFERVTRIFPFYWVALPFTYAINLLDTETMMNLTGLWGTVSNVLLLPWTLNNIFSMINATCWYLVVLLLLYWILWAILFFTVRNSRNPVPFYAILVFCGFSAKMDIAPFNIISSPVFRGLIAFFIGCFLFHFNKFFSGKRSSITFLIVLIGCSVAIFLIPDLRDNIYMIITAILFPTLILFCLNFDWLEGILSHRWMQILGSSSYIVFILNTPFLIFHQKVLFLHVPDNICGNVLVMFSTTIAIVALSVLSHLYIEKPLTAFFFHLLQNKHLLPVDSEQEYEKP